MNKLILFTTMCCLSIALVAQSEPIETEAGDLTIHPILHSSIVMQWGELMIFVDPYGGAEKYAAFDAPDLVLITDIHGDHMNKETLGELDLANAILIAPGAVFDQLGDLSSSRKVTLSNGESAEELEIEIEAIPMYNLPETDDSRHPKGRGNGYVITIGGKRIYISGDTEDIAEMRALEDIDVAFVCMNLPYTMDVNQAADAVIEFSPAIVYPFHYRGGGGKFSNVEEFKTLVNDGNAEVEVRLLNWYPED